MNHVEHIEEAERLVMLGFDTSKSAGYEVRATVLAAAQVHALLAIASKPTDD